MESIQSIIEREIPIVKEMGVKFESIGDDRCVISVPLAPNHNHKGTAYGGSLYSVCTAASYGLLYALQLKHELHEYDLLITDGKIKYTRPVPSNFHVKSTLNLREWSDLLKELPRKGFGKLRIDADVYLESDASSLCHFEGIFVLKRS